MTSSMGKAMRKDAAFKVFAKGLDRGSQYSGHEFQGMLAGDKMKSSINRKGNCLDNVHKAILSGRLNVGRLYGQKFLNRKDAMDGAIQWLAFYSHRRSHCTLGYVSPMQYERRKNAAQQSIEGGTMERLIGTSNRGRFNLIVMLFHLL